MDFCRTASGRLKIERIPNHRIRKIINVKHIIIDDIKDKHLLWFVQVKQILKAKIPKQVRQWKSEGKKTQKNLA